MAIDFIASAAELAEREQWLAEHAEEARPYLVDGLPCLVFTFDREEPADRYTTRYGGVPVWPAEVPWPVCPACGRNVAFVGQLDFRHPAVRGSVEHDVLTLHYCWDCHPWSPLEPGGVVRARHDADDGTPLIEPAEVPPYPSDDLPPFGPYHGTPHEVVDCPHPPREAPERHAYALQATKIGGQLDPPNPVATPVDSAGEPMAYLATFGPVQNYQVDGRDCDEPYDGVMWGDMGSLILWRSVTPGLLEMSWDASCF